MPELSDAVPEATTEVDVIVVPFEGLVIVMAGGVSSTAWRGYEWSPYPTYWIVERESRMMFLWPDYDEQNIYGLGNRWCKFLEKFSGYGPGPPGGFVVK